MAMNVYLAVKQGYAPVSDFGCNGDAWSLL